MRTLVAGLALAVSAAAQQGTVVYAANGETARNVQEIAAAVRVMSGSRQVSVDSAGSAVSMDGTPEQVTLAKWLAGELTNPTGHEYKEPAGGDVVRVFPLSRSAKPRELMELATIVRSITAIARISTYMPQPAMAVRGTAAQVELAAWLVDEIGKAAAQASGPVGMRAGDDDMVRLFFLSPKTEGVREIATLVRTLGDISLVMTYTAPPVLAVRASEAQLELAAWLIDDLTKSDAGAGAHEYRMQGADDGAVRVFYLPAAVTPQGLQQAAAAVRKTAKVPRVFTYSERKAVAMRGTPEQAASAARAIEEAR